MTAHGPASFQLRSDAVALPVSDGVRWFTESGVAHVRGSSVAQLLIRLLPALDGSNTLDELTLGLDLAQRTAVFDLVSLGRDLGAIDQVLDGTPETATGRLVRLSGGDESLFDCLCRSSVVVIGQGGFATSTADALRRGGMRNVITGDDARLISNDSAATTAIVQVIALNDLLGRASARVAASADALTRMYQADGICCVQAAVSDRYALIPSAGVPWGDILERLTPLGRSSLIDLRHAEDDGARMQAVDYIGARLARTLIRRATGIDEVEGLTVIDLVHLNAKKHSVAPKARARMVDAKTVKREIDRLKATSSVEAEAFDRVASRLIDSWFGLVCELRDSEEPQVPGRVVEARFHAAGVEHVVTGRAGDYATAIHRAVLDALGFLAVANMRRCHGVLVEGVRMADGSTVSVTLDSPSGRAVAALSFDGLLVEGLGCQLVHLVLAADFTGVPIDIGENWDLLRQVAYLRAIGLEPALWSITPRGSKAISVALVAAVIDARMRAVVVAGSVMDATRTMLDNLLTNAPEEVRKQDFGPAPQRNGAAVAELNSATAFDTLGERLLSALTTFEHDVVIVPCLDDTAIALATPFTAWVEIRKAGS